STRKSIHPSLLPPPDFISCPPRSSDSQRPNMRTKTSRTTRSPKPRRIPNLCLRSHTRLQKSWPPSRQTTQPKSETSFFADSLLRPSKPRPQSTSRNLCHFIRSCTTRLRVNPVALAAPVNPLVVPIFKESPRHQ